jgi:hypothetical protein
MLKAVLLHEALACFPLALFFLENVLTSYQIVLLAKPFICRVNDGLSGTVVVVVNFEADPA